MISSYDAIIIGAGHNGLVTAGYLARAGWKVLVLERRHIVGGACVTEEVFPGYRVSTASYLVSLLQDKVVRELELPRYGYKVFPKDPAYFAPYPDGRYMFMYQDMARTCREIAKFSAKDAERYPAYEAYIERIARLIEPLFLQPPPQFPPQRLSDWLDPLRAGRTLLGLSNTQLADAIKLMTRSVQTILDEWFESDALKVALATDGVIGTNGGPHTPGTAYVLLHHVMGGVGGVRGLWGFVEGGMGAITQALAASAQAHGTDIRTDAPVARVMTRDDTATGVVLQNGSEFHANVVISNADPRRTFLQLVERNALPDEFVAQIESYQCEGTSFKINLGLGELPDYSAFPGTALGPQHRGTTHICPSMEYLERAWDDAKYGQPSTHPLLEITIPTAYDPTLAPDGKHIMGIFVQYAPYQLKDSTWADEKEGFVQRVLDILGAYAPNLPRAIEHVHALSPLDLEQEYGLPGGNIFHGALSLDQLFFMRPALGWARYATPIRNLYLCGSGAHPGGGVTGAPGHNAAMEILQKR
ncbi:MAG: NAD(P)/FAD-dependent oxidoreductase [Chloroflexota bacterium]|nr:NAD(P)/FAD-dependent oxidoreductase [Chloroflexota bacterium]